MKHITAIVNKSSVLHEVAKITSYIGAKSIDEKEKAYERFFTTDEDRNVIENFWQEASGLITLSISRYIETVTEHLPGREVDFLTDNFEVTIKVTDRFDNSQEPVFKSQLFHYFVNMLVGKWLELSDMQRAQVYLKKAEDCASAIQIALHKKNPPSRN